MKVNKGSLLTWREELIASLYNLEHLDALSSGVESLKYENKKSYLYITEANIHLLLFVKSEKKVIKNIYKIEDLKIKTKSVLILTFVIGNTLQVSYWIISWVMNPYS